MVGKFMIWRVSHEMIFFFKFVIITSAIKLNISNSLIYTCTCHMTNIFLLVYFVPIWGTTEGKL